MFQAAPKSERPFCLQVNGWIHIVYIFLIQFLPQQLDRFAEALEVDDLTLPEEFYHIIHIRIVTERKILS